MKLIFWLCLSVPGFAALPNGTTWEVRHAGSNSNGGGYVTGSSGTDFSQQTAAQVAYTDMVLGTGGTSYTSVLNPVGATLPGNIVQIISGAGCTPGFYEVASTVTITANLDRSAGTATSVCTANLGGALASMGTLNTAMSTTASINQGAWVKADATYVSGRLNINFTSNGFDFITGYSTTRGDNGMPTLQMNTADFFIDLQTGANTVFSNFILDMNGNSGGGVLFFGTCCQTAVNISIINGGPNVGFWFAGGRTTCDQCFVTGLNGGVSAFFDQTGNGDLCFYCIAYANTNTAQSFQLSQSGGGASGSVCIRCIAANNPNTTASFVIVANVAPITILNSIAVNNGGDGLNLPGTSNIFPLTVLNSIFVLNTGFGINSPSVTIPQGAELFNFNAFFSNTMGARSGVSAGANDVTLTGNPFVNSAANNFALNNTGGAGAALRAAGVAGILAVGGTGFIDIGALQHQDSGGSGGAGSFAFVQ